MAIQFGELGGIVLSWASSFIFWGIVIVLVVGGGTGMLWIMQKKKFKFPLIEVTSIGVGKVAMEVMKCGWFKEKRAYFGLVEVGGEQEMICSVGKRKVYNVSSSDYHEINGKRGLIVKRKDDDPEVLVPLSEVEIKNLHLLAEIAPADYRDVGVSILDDRKKEAYSWWDENKATVMTVGVIIFAIIALVIIFNFAQNESSAWREFAQSSRVSQPQPSTAP